MATPAYRQWLQGIVNGTVSGGSPQNRVEASALLQVVGDDGNIDARFIQDPYAFTGTDRGQVFSTTEGSGNNVGYGPQGISKTNDAFKALYLNEYPDGFTAPTAGAGGGGGGGSSISSQEQARLAAEAAERNTLRGDIASRGLDIDRVYEALFGDLNTLVSTRDKELEDQYGEQLKTASDQFAAAMPEIANSYAALGAYDSTDRSRANKKSEEGFEQTTKTIGSNKAKDKAALGTYKQENEAKFTADRESAKRNAGRAGETEDIGALRSMRNDLESNLGTANVTRATLGTEGSARKAITDLTKDSGRYEAAINALDQILKSSMSGAVKEAAVTAVTDSAGLSEEEKKKVQETYGNVYAEQAAL